jgi:hypothetical protein
MTDREMLELAAKAAGWTGFQSKHGYWRLEASDGTIYNVYQGRGGYCPNTGVALEPPTMAEALLEAGWDPLNDDGDALRLAVKLDMQIWRNTGGTVSAMPPGDVIGFWNRLKDDVAPDPCAAYRRAIVRAAAAIGESMP